VVVVQLIRLGLNVPLWINRNSTESVAPVTVSTQIHDVSETPTGTEVTTKSSVQSFTGSAMVASMAVPPVVPNKTRPSLIDGWSPKASPSMITVMPTSPVGLVTPFTRDISGGTAVKALARVSAPPSGLVTTTSYSVPASTPAGAAANSDPPSSSTTLDSSVPRETAAPAWNPVPSIRSSVPAVPVSGATNEITGGSTSGPVPSSPHPARTTAHTSPTARDRFIAFLCSCYVGDCRIQGETIRHRTTGAVGR
jgi:hypothetical protein